MQSSCSIGSNSPVDLPASDWPTICDRPILFFSVHFRTAPKDAMSNRNLPNIDKITDKKKCAMIYWNLIELTKSKSEDTAPYFLREFYQTQRCDNFYDFSENRQDFEAYLGPKTIENVLNYEEEKDPKDIKKVAQAVFHYNAWSRKTLLKALPFSTWMYYHTVYMAERTFAAIGVLGTGYTAWKFAGKQLQKVYPLKKVQDASTK